MGNKSQARKVAMENKVPVIPGSTSTITNQQEAVSIAHKIGFPVLIKAAAGGGGRGMRIAHNDASLANALAMAQREAETAFKDSSLYIEKYIEHARHVEVQILADQHGTILHLGERDCSLQRRHQKLMEETPWEKYGVGNDPRCANCMMHSGFEPTVTRLVGRRWRDMWEMVRWNFS